MNFAKPFYLGFFSKNSQGCALKLMLTGLGVRIKIVKMVNLNHQFTPIHQ